MVSAVDWVLLLCQSICQFLQVDTNSDISWRLDHRNRWRGPGNRLRDHSSLLYSLCALSQGGESALAELSELDLDWLDTQMYQRWLCWHVWQGPSWMQSFCWGGYGYCRCQQCRWSKVCCWVSFQIDPGNPSYPQVSGTSQLKQNTGLAKCSSQVL